MINAIRGWAWQIACFLWVAAPILGFWTKTHPWSYQFGTWILASILVLALAPLAEVKYKSKFPALLLLAFFIVLFSHLSNFGLGFTWVLRCAVILPAAAAISERVSFKRLVHMLNICAILQIPIILLQLSGMKVPWDSAGGGLTGSLYKRPALSILAGALAIWNGGIFSYLFAALAFASTSMAGALPVLGKLLNKYMPISLVALLAIAFVVLVLLWIPSVSTRLDTRLSSWKGIAFIKDGWLTGWGFFPLPGAFGESTDNDRAVQSAMMSDYHSTYLDWIGRFGLIGILAIAPVVARIARLTFRQLTNQKLWAFLLACFACLVQSAEAFAVMCLLGLVWMKQLDEEESIRVDSLQKLATN